ncbi:NAD(P)H-binding protein [Actinoplanes sp. NPDC049599]|uniref:NAD(P)H-binding protein n=1 Tax=Actinoplanes sp. NPDC049599 TaxID=3363903 RepID=UPI00379485E3
MMLITGATGNVGREAMRLLGDRAVGLSRATPLGTVAHVEGVLYSPRAATPERLAWAAERGAKRVVVLSAATVSHPVGDPRFIAEFTAAEAAARRSGLEWTILRSTDYAANALAWAPQLRRGGVVRGAYPGAVTSTVDERDVAAVAVRALLDPAHAGRTYLLTGPQPLTQAEKVRELGRATGREPAFAEITPEQARQGMLAAGLPAEIPDRLLGSLADYARAPGPSSTTVAELLGRPARTFGEWADDHRAAFL